MLSYITHRTTQNLYSEETRAATSTRSSPTSEQELKLQADKHDLVNIFKKTKFCHFAQFGLKITHGNIYSSV